MKSYFDELELFQSAIDGGSLDAAKDAYDAMPPPMKNRALNAISPEDCAKFCAAFDVQR